MNSSRFDPYINRSLPNFPPPVNEKPSFSSLFSNEIRERNNNRNSGVDNGIWDSPPSDDDDGVYLQISNLDQWYDESNLRNYLMNQLKPITPILSLTIETPSIAKVKVPSMQVRKSRNLRHFETKFDSSFCPVRKASSISLASKENGTQAHLCVFHEG